MTSTAIFGFLPASSLKTLADFAQTDDVLMGAASSFAEQAYNVGRNATLLAGFDHHVPGCTVTRYLRG
jgi:acetyl-CoA acetyltransferase